MIKFRLKEDWYVTIPFTTETKKIYDKGYVFLPNEDGEYIIKSGETESYAIIEYMRTLKNMKEITETSKLIIEEVPDDDDNQIKSWRIQLDVQTTRKKLKEIEKILNKELQNYM